MSDRFATRSGDVELGFDPADHQQSSMPIISPVLNFT